MIKATKISIIENKAIKGGLKNAKQRYSIYYLEPVFDNLTQELIYEAKISIEHYIEREGIERQKSMSLRLNNALMVRELIMELSGALALFEKKQHKQVYSEQGISFFNSKKRQLLEEVNEAYNQGLTATTGHSPRYCSTFG